MRCGVPTWRSSSGWVPSSGMTATLGPLPHPPAVAAQEQERAQCGPLPQSRRAKVGLRVWTLT